MENEKRLTDANAMVTLMCRACNNECCEDPCEPGECFIYDALANAPTVDAVEVVHAKWEQMGEADYKCSVCGFRFTSADPISMFQYCRCGAKMDGGNEDG